MLSLSETVQFFGRTAEYQVDDGVGTLQTPQRFDVVADVGDHRSGPVAHEQYTFDHLLDVLEVVEQVLWRE